MTPSEKNIYPHTIYAAARLAHEANRAYCKSIGDDTQLPWADAPDWQKLSCLNGAGRHWEALEGHAPISPQQSHDSWMEYKQGDGWSYGPVKDPIRKTHPCMVPYKDLPEEQRVKDSIFGAVIAAVYNLYVQGYRV